MARKIWYPESIHSKVSTEIKERLKKVAEAKRITLSETIRIILEDYLQ